MSLKTIKLGGMRGVMEAGRLCEELGLKVNVAAKTGEFEHRLRGGDAYRRGAAADRLGPHPLERGLADDVTARPIRIERGHVEVSDRPGLGIDVDEDRVRRYRRDVPQSGTWPESRKETFRMYDEKSQRKSDN